MMKMCCKDMLENIYYTDNNKDNQTDKVVYYSSKFNEYGLPIHDGENGRATSYIQIQHCPWCGKKLPESQRDEWFDCLERLGFDSPLESLDEIPSKFKTSEWYE